MTSSQLLYVNEGNLSEIDVQKTFEKNLFEKSKKLTNSKTLSPTESKVPFDILRMIFNNTAEIFTYSQFNVLFKGLNDIFIFVLGDYEENELVNNSI